jgi:hypothetical protein
MRERAQRDDRAISDMRINPLGTPKFAGRRMRSEAVSAPKVRISAIRLIAIVNATDAVA